MSSRRLIVIGAGPVGLAAMLGAVRRGWSVTVLEKDEVGASLLRWGSTRFFSPLSMNLLPGVESPMPGDAILTGAEFVQAVLTPMAVGRALEQHRVVAVSRAGLGRGDLAGHPLRAERPFRLLVETPEGERIFESDAVIDASGTYGQPVPLCVPGERALGERIIRDLGALHARLGDLEGKRVLLAGHGHSAAHAIAQLVGVAKQVVWAARSLNQRPCVEVCSDPLPERQSVVALANQFAAKPPEWLKMERRAAIECISMDAGGLRVALGGTRAAVVDEIVALTGYRPDLSFLSELAVEIAPVTEGAARLTRALSNITDCLSVPTLSPEDLESGEPGFYLAGAKSYGRSRTFLLKTGYAQLETILDRLDAGQRAD